MSINKAWWDKPLRVVVLEYPASDVGKLNLKEIIDETARGAVNTLVSFSIGYYPGGAAFYQSKIAHHHPGIGNRDLLAEAIEFGHKNGQKVMAHMSTIFGGGKLYEDHPDWAQRRANGDLSSWDDELKTVAMCPNSPYRQYLNSLVLEISNNYSIDGYYFDESCYQSWCNCEYCQKKFLDETGSKLPTVEDWDSSLFKKLIKWRYNQITNWRRELYELGKKDDRCIWFQGAFPLASLKPRLSEISGLPEASNFYQERVGLDWPVPLAHGVYLPEAVGNADKVHFELYRVLVQEPLWWYGIALRYGQSFSKQKQIMTLHMIGESPFDAYGLPEAELRLSNAEILANNGTPLVARYYPDRVDQEMWKNVYTIFKETETLDSYMISRESIKYAAVFFSQETSDFYDQKKNTPAHLSELKGISKALLQKQVLFDVIIEDNLKDLSKYKVVILPNTSYLSKKVKDILKDYVKNGGGLVATFESGIYNEFGERTPAEDFSELFGISYNSSDYQFKGFDSYMRMRKNQDINKIVSEKLIPTGGVQLNIEAKTGDIVAEIQGESEVHFGPLTDNIGSPIIVKNEKSGDGRVVYYAFPIGNRYLEFGVYDHFNMINEAVLWAAKETPPVRVQNAPNTVALTAFKQSDAERIIIHLVNSVRDEINQPILELNPCKGIILFVKTNKKPSHVFEAAGTDLGWLLKDSEIKINIPEFYDHKIIVIEDKNLAEVDNG